MEMAKKMAVEIQRSNKVKKRPAAYPSLFGADSDEECLSDSASDSEDQARPSLLPLSVSGGRGRGYSSCMRRVCMMSLLF